MISLFAAEDQAAKLDRIGDPLQVLDKHIDFAAIAATVDAELTIGRSAKGGRPAWPTEVMVRLLVLQQLFNLSDRHWSSRRWTGAVSCGLRAWSAGVGCRMRARCGSGASGSSTAT